MARYKLILCLLLLHRIGICSYANEIARSSLDRLALEEPVVNADVRKTVTEQLVRVEDESRHLSGRDTTALDDIESTDDELWNLDRFLKLWDPIDVSRIWRNDTYRDAGVSLSCGQDLTRYMTGVSGQTNWALRMMDTDGKRTWGTFSGNRYWIGDTNQCRQMENQFVERQRDERVHQSEELPPFRVSVNSVSFVLQICKAGLNAEHNITLGLCLPITCDVTDVEKLLYFVQNQSGTDTSSSFEITIDHIRNLSEGYTLWEDTTFYILLASFIVVCVLILMGTLYDLALRYKVLRRQYEESNNNNAVTESRFLKPDGSFDHEITILKLWEMKTHNGSFDVRNSKTVPRPFSEALLSFSLLVNMSKLCVLDVGVDTLAPIHGIRFYSMLWIILIHTCLIVNEISDNTTFRKAAESDFLYQTIGNGTYAVDTFFFISGCLVTFLYYRTIADKRMQEKELIKGYWGQFLQFLGMTLYRYFRLTPIYLLIIGLVQVSSKWYHDHSMIEFSALDYKTCEKFWWRNALYINTYFKMDERCIVWSWYLANDAQFYTVGIIILIIGASFLPVAAFITAFFLITSWVTTAVITLNTRHVPSIQDPFAHYESLYDKPWTRIGPYLIGMATGWYLFRVDCKANMNKAVVAAGWSLSLITMVSIVYGLHGTILGPILSALYMALSHSGWAICMAWILIACVTGHGGVVDHILSWKYLYPTARLTYCTYLVHPLLIKAIILNVESSWHLTNGFMAILFFGFVVMSYATSLFLSLLFEAPVVSLLRIVHPIREWK